MVDVNLDSYTSLYPNPASKSVNVVCSYKIKDYALVDATGREVLSGKCNANSMALDLSSLQKGVYFIRLQTAKGSVEKKLIGRVEQYLTTSGFWRQSLRLRRCSLCELTALL